MKKEKIKKALALGLALVLSVSAAGCGKGGTGGENGPDGGSGATGGNNPTLAKENVYSYREIDLEGMGDAQIFGSHMEGDQVYLLTSSYREDPQTGGYGQILELVVMDKDGSNPRTISLEAPDNSNEPDSGIVKPEGAGDGQNSGAIAVPRTYTEDSLDIAIEEPGWAEKYPTYSYFENNNYNNAIFAGGMIYALRVHNINYSDENGDQYVNYNHVDCWDMEGNLLWDTYTDISQYQNDDTYSYVMGMTGTSDGAALLMTGDKVGCIMISKDGTSSPLKESKNDLTILQRYNSMLVKEDGTILIAYYDENWEKQYLTTYNPETDTMGEQYDIPFQARYMYNISTSSFKDIIYSDQNGLYGFNLGDTEVVKIMDYVNSDLPTYGVRNVVMIDEKHFFANYDDSTDYSCKFASFTYVAPEDIQDKQVLVYGGTYIDSDVKSQIINFNKSNSQYRIVIRDYSQYNTDDDYMAGFTQLNNDIMANKMPDIIQVDYTMPMDSYISKGLLASVDDLIKNDPELSQVEFTDNVFEAFRVNGVLYQVIPRFTVSTYLGKTSIVGDRTSWNMQELLQAADKMPSDASIFGMITREDFLYNALSYCGSDFVDINTGKCSFDSELFIQLLEFAKTLPDQSIWEDGSFDWDEYYSDYESQYRENRTMLKSSYISDFMNMKREINGFFGEPVSFIGFPTESGVGSYVDATISFAISAKNGNAEGAWQFLRTMLTETYQRGDERNYSYGLSVHKKILQEQKQRAMEKPYWIDEETGEKHEYDDYFYMNGQEFILEPLNQQQADQIYNFVTSVTKRPYNNEDVRKIVSEEADSFFNGPKSARDVAGLIQNRVQLFVNENR